MLDKLKLLVDVGKIHKSDYDIFILFHLDERGRNWLNRKVEHVFMEAPSTDKGEMFAWLDGRRSMLREIKVVIEYVNKALEETTE